MNSHQSIILLALTITLCSAHIGGGQVSFQDANPQVYCGRSLARALAFLCPDDGGSEIKRSDAGSMYNAILPPYYKEQEGFGWPWLAPHKARGMSLPSRGKRFVVNECCDKACSLSELLSYC
uniref:Insulin-like polypeptide D n=1 Tax=Helicoverpa armigera TaxID=29058 RepID=M4QG01_HELAM|nr:insulin-like precursor polypeptide D [Helicoverpa armigera]